MRRIKNIRVRGLLTALIVPFLLLGSALPAAAQCADLPGCVLVWSDEFDGTEVDPTKATTSCSTTRPTTPRSRAAS